MKKYFELIKILIFGLKYILLSLIVNNYQQIIHYNVFEFFFGKEINYSKVIHKHVNIPNFM